VGGWDPFNVTEDADLGVRLHRSGRGVGVLESVTLEEANSDFINWVKQRSRWYKGYLQTWLLNLRHPIRTGRSLGWRGYAVFNLFVGGTPMLAIVNPIFWALTLAWFLVQPAFVLDIFPAPLLYAGLMCWIVGNFFLLYTGLVTSVTRKDGVLVWAALTMPLYYVMMSLAAYKALYQLVANSSYWEKTVHGLAAQPSEAA
jgi:cellulose synthase/poly-beta-1,6-N-acetylglucosamine synthase-like glycosyltransferase